MSKKKPTTLTKKQKKTTTQTKKPTRPISTKKNTGPIQTKKSTRPFPIPKHLRIEPFWQELNKVIDPEINIGVVDLGLIYDIRITNGKALITMSLTTPACPYGPTLLKQIEDRLRLYRDVKSVQIKIVWDPVWNQEMIDPDIRDLMFGF